VLAQTTRALVRGRRSRRVDGPAKRTRGVRGREGGSVARDALAAQKDVGPGLAVCVRARWDRGLREGAGYLRGWAVLAVFC
jgi:hypothetical protein